MLISELSTLVSIAAPFNPEKYIQAIRLCEASGMEVIILDSCSHEWDGPGGILDIHSNMAGNSFTNWSKITPRHNAFIQALLQSNAHIIGTIRSKQDYVLQEKNGKMVPEKVGLKGVTRDGMDYEFTVVLEMDIKHNASASKDRTGLFVDRTDFRITVETGKEILCWCNLPETQSSSNLPSLQVTIDNCASIEELIHLYKTLSPQDAEDYQSAFTQKRRELDSSHSTFIHNPLKSSLNGQHIKPSNGSI